MLAASLGAAATSVWLDRNADRLRQTEQARRWAGVAARMSEGREGACLETLLSALAHAESGLGYLRVEAGDGAVLAQTGDPKRFPVRFDRTLPSATGPVRVRIGYEEPSRPVAWGIRACFWALLVAGFQGVAAVLAGRRR